MRLGPSWMGLVPLSTQRALLLPPTRWGHSRKMGCLWTRKWCLTRHWIWWNLDLGLPSVRNWEMDVYSLNQPVNGSFCYSHPIKQLFLTGTILYSFVFPSLNGHLQCPKTLLVVMAAGRCYWHLVARGKGCCSVSYNAQDKTALPLPHSHMQQGILLLKISLVQKLRNPAWAAWVL